MLGSAMETRYSKTGVLVEGDFVSVRYDLKPEACAPGGVDHPFFLNQGGLPLGSATAKAQTDSFAVEKPKRPCGT